MLSPRFAKVMLNQYRKDNPVGIADSTFRGAATRYLETKFGWGHAQFKRDLADKIEELTIDPSWRPNEVLRYVAKLVRDS
jgi:hypothetical protein